MRHSHRNVVYAANADGKCFYCHQSIDGASLSIATVDHVWPDSLRGSSRPCNLIPACHSCNSKRGDAVPDFFKLSLDELEKLLAAGTPPTWLAQDPNGNVFVKKGYDRDRFLRDLYCLVNKLAAAVIKERGDNIKILRDGEIKKTYYCDLLNE